MSNGSQPFNGGSPVILHPPADAETAELMQDRGVWMVLYRPDGSTDEIDDETLRSEIGGVLDIGRIVGYVEGRLRATERIVLRDHFETDSRHTVVAVWTLGRSES